MSDKKMSNFELASMNYFLTRAFLIGATFNFFIQIIKQDSWILPIIGFVFHVLIILIINYIINYKPEYDFADKLLNLFSNKWGIILITIIIVAQFSLLVINYLGMIGFVQNLFLNKTPLIVINILFGLTIFYISIKGINTISRTSNILFYISVFIVILSFIGLIHVFDLNNLRPSFTLPTSDYLKGFNFFYSFSILPIMLLTSIPKDYIKNPKIKKTLMLSSLVSCISIFLIVFQTISTFGYELVSLYKYPEFVTLKHFSLIPLMTRFESILVLPLIFDGFVYCMITIYFIVSSIKSISKNINTNTLYLLLCLALIAISTIISRYSIYIYSTILDYLPVIFGSIITILIIIICVKIKINKR